MKPTKEELRHSFDQAMQDDTTKKIKTYDTTVKYVPQPLLPGDLITLDSGVCLTVTAPSSRTPLHLDPSTTNDSYEVETLERGSVVFVLWPAIPGQFDNKQQRRARRAAGRVSGQMGEMLCELVEGHAPRQLMSIHRDGSQVYATPTKEEME